MWLTCLILAAATTAATTAPAPAHPPTYSCPAAGSPIVVDGKLDEPAWAQAAWTDNFADIRGSDQAAPPLRTRAKLLWDDRCLYLAAELEENDIRGEMRDHDAPLWRENAFELFLDPDDDGRNYLELEINARGTVLDLVMTMPYKQKGRARMGWQVEGLKSAVQVDGTLNDPSDRDRKWMIELAIPWGAIKELAPDSVPPPPNARLRMNMARMQYERGAEQVQASTWSPHGEVNMHMPPRWGYLVLKPSE